MNEATNDFAVAYRDNKISRKNSNENIMVMVYTFVLCQLLVSTNYNLILITKVLKQLSLYKNGILLVNFETFK